MQISCIFGFVLFLLAGCNAAAPQPGIQVVFDGRPNIAQHEVYFANKVVGEMTSRQAGNGSVELISLNLAPEFKQQVGRHWVFFVDHGRIRAARIGSSGKPLAADEMLCGFRSKSALNWFKFTTLLSDRVYRASKRAQLLHRRSL
jgi:hypothetical protein